MKRIGTYIAVCAALAVLWTSGVRAAEAKHIVFVAGSASHGQAAHAYHAGFSYLADVLEENTDDVKADVRRGWPDDGAVLKDADAVVIGSDAGKLIRQNLKSFKELTEAGTGVACIHYTLDVRKEPAEEAVLRAIGGFYDTHWSVNPFWTADFTSLPDHPIARGVEPFKIRDEWYYHMRFREDMEGVTPVLTAVPPDKTRKGPDGPHSGNPHVRERMGMPEHVGWAYERPDGGRGFGFTGLHSHWNLANTGFRTILLNACLWTAGAEVPEGGVPSEDPTHKELAEYLP